MTFRDYLLLESKSNEFQSAFDEFKTFLRKWDQIGLEKYARIVGTGYFRVIYDFLSSLYHREGDVGRQARNVMKLLPSTLLFGTALPAAGFVDIGSAGLVVLGLKSIQYLYYPFWLWASKNLKNADPEIVRRAEMVVAAIPDQWREILSSESVCVQ